MDLIKPLNQSRPYLNFFHIEYLFDCEHCEFFSFIHIGSMLMLNLNVTLAKSLIFIVLLIHGCGKFVRVGFVVNYCSSYRLNISLVQQFQFTFFCRHRLKNITNPAVLYYCRNDFNKEIDQRIRMCINRHAEAIEFSHAIQDMTSVTPLIWGFLQIWLLATNIVMVCGRNKKI